MTRKRIKQLLFGESGTATVWLAAGISMILGMAAIAIDTGYLYAEENRLQATADSAVLAASYQFINGGRRSSTAA